MTLSTAELIGHPERLDRNTLHELRELVQQYPYFQAARLLLLQNLYLLRDPSFGETLRQAALLIPDRSVLFQMVESSHYELRPEKPAAAQPASAQTAGNRTLSLIDEFLRTNTPQEEPATPRRKPTAADATQDYVAYLLQMDDLEPAAEPDNADNGQTRRSNDLIDDFIENKPDRIVLQDKPEYVPEVAAEAPGTVSDEDYFTETLAKIYVRQGRYEKALEIIRKLNLDYPKKNRYFADQIRFLQKLIINNQNKNNV